MSTTSRGRTTRALVGLTAAAVALPVLALGPIASDAATSPTTTPGLSPLSDRRVVTGWIPYWDLNNGVDAVVADADVVAEVSPYWYRMTATSKVQPLADNDLAESTLVAGIDELHASGIAALPTITDEGIGATAMARLLRDTDRRSALLDSIVAMVQRTGSDGVDIDFEDMNFGSVGADRTAVKRLFPVFLEKLRARLQARGALLAVSLPPRKGASDPAWEVYDYDAIARTVDRARIMTYDYSYSTPGPTSPIDWVRDSMDYARREFRGVPLSIGVPAYGRNWFVKKLSGTCPDGVRATAVPTSVQALALADTYGAKLQWSDSAQEYHFDYERPYPDADNPDCVVLRRVWFGDSRAAEVRLRLAERWGIQGIAVWRFGAEEPRLWNRATVVAGGITPDPARSSLSAPERVDHGSEIALAARFTVAGLPVVGREVSVQRRVPGGSWMSVATVTTGAQGRASYLALGQRTLDWRMRLAEGWDWDATLTGVARVDVRHVLDAALDDATVAAGTPYLVSGTLQPAVEGTKVTLQKRKAGEWLNVRSGTTAADGSFTLTGSFAAAGSYTVRVIAPADSQHATGASAQLTVTVE